MKQVLSRTQLVLVFVGYAGFLAIAAAALYERRLFELRDPVAASGGMAAAGDTLLFLFLGFLFLIPTALLIWVISKSPGACTAYSKFLLGLSLSGPLCLGLLALGEKHVAEFLSWLSFFRIAGSPVVLVGMAGIRLAARFEPAKKLTMYALVIEAMTLGLLVVGFVIVVFVR